MFMLAGGGLTKAEISNNLIYQDKYQLEGGLPAEPSRGVSGCF